MKILNHTGSLIVFIILVTALNACGPNISYYTKLNEQLREQNYAAALEEHRRNKKSYGKSDRVLYYLDEGLLAHLAGQYEESNQAFLKAENDMADLYTLSVSREAASFLLNDNTIEYPGEDFEGALVNLFLALNYMKLGKLEEALVEARKVDSKLNTFNLQYSANEKNVYKEDAFIRYLMGVLYLADGETNDAFISFSKAEEIYRKDYQPNYGVQPPLLLIEDLLFTAKKMNFMDEYRRYKKSYPTASKQLKERNTKEAQVYFINFNGIGAEKVERSMFVPMPDKYVLKIAYPEFVKRDYRATGTLITLTHRKSRQEYQLSSQVMEDISAIAQLNLKNRIGRITAKAVARVTAKYLLSKESEKKALEKGDKDLARVIRFTFQTYMIAFEAADIRHWRLLPAQIQVSRSILPPGDYEGIIQLLDRTGKTVTTRPVAPFSISPGETKLVTFRTME